MISYEWWMLVSNDGDGVDWLLLIRVFSYFNVNIVYNYINYMNIDYDSIDYSYYSIL
jgi:hypothetical protein